MQPGILSGGSQLFADHLKDRLGLDYAFGNQLEIRGNTFTGRITGEVIVAPQKARLVNWIADQGGIPLDQTVAIGDGPTMPSCSVRRDWELPTMPGSPQRGCCWEYPKPVPRAVPSDLPLSGFLPPPPSLPSRSGGRSRGFSPLECPRCP